MCLWVPREVPLGELGPLDFVEEKGTLVDNNCIDTFLVVYLHPEKQYYRIMKKESLSLSMMASSLSAMAKSYPYLTIEMAGGKKTSISTASLTFFIQDGKLMAGTMELTVAVLSKLHFSTRDETTRTS